MKTAAIPADNGIATRGLERYAQELENDGLTVLPPEVTGVSSQLLDRCVNRLLAEFERLTGCPISLEAGPEGELQWPESSKLPAFLTEPGAPPQTQVILQQLLRMDRCFRDLAVNPAVDALIDHLVGRIGNDPARRLSSVNSFMKWQGDFGYGSGLGLHVDQNSCPLPWGRSSLNANASWCLTDYTLEGGALAYVPGSHKQLCRPQQPEAATMAVPVECERGSVIIFQGATWHGAFPKQTPGMRLNTVVYYRHMSILPQENLSVTMRDQPWDDCDDPKLLRELIGFDDQFPYLEQHLEIPRLIGGERIAP